MRAAETAPAPRARCAPPGRPLLATAAVAVAIATTMLAGAPYASASPPRDGGPRGQDEPSEADRRLQVAVPDGGRPAANVPADPDEGSEPPAGPAPRLADGRVHLESATPGGQGIWLPGLGGFAGLERADGSAPPFQPWAAAVHADRGANQLEPHTRCKPSGGARQFLTPYGVEIVELPAVQRIYIFDIGGPHTYRTIYMDGRTHPIDANPAFYGHSIGWWDGDTLVVDTTGYNEGFWIDRGGLPTTSRLHTVERFTRTDEQSMIYELTIDDAGAYTEPWTARLDLRWEEGTELFEYVCQQANYADELMVGQFQSVDRTAVTVP